MDHNDNPEANQSVSKVEGISDERNQNNTSGKMDTNKQETSYLEEYLKQQQYTYQNIAEQNLPGRFQPAGDQFQDYSVTGQQAELDDDKMFLLSLVPYFKKLEDSKKLQARITVTKLVHDLLYKTS